MKLTFEKPHQSITSFEEIELNDFAIITGLNGSGKTHLLNAINLGNIKVEGIEPSEIVFYNYSDFTIYNGDPGQDAQIQQRFSSFTNNSNVFSQKLNNDRQQALNSFQLNLPFENQVRNFFGIQNVFKGIGGNQDVHHVFSYKFTTFTGFPFLYAFKLAIVTSINLALASFVAQAM